MKKAAYLLVVVFILALIGLGYDVHNPRAVIPILDRITVLQGRWEAWRNPSAKYGVSYKCDHGEDYEVTMLDFRLETDKGKIEGYSFIGDDLTLDFQKEGNNPIPEIFVRSSHGHRDAARLVIKDGKAVGFHIVEGKQIGVYYALEGFHSL